MVCLSMTPWPIRPLLALAVYSRGFLGWLASGTAVAWRWTLLELKLGLLRHNISSAASKQWLTYVCDATVPVEMLSASS